MLWRPALFCPGGVCHSGIRYAIRRALQCSALPSCLPLTLWRLLLPFRVLGLLVHGRAVHVPLCNWLAQEMAYTTVDAIDTFSCACSPLLPLLLSCVCACVSVCLSVFCVVGRSFLRTSLPRPLLGFASPLSILLSILLLPLCCSTLFWRPVAPLPCSFKLAAACLPSADWLPAHCQHLPPSSSTLPCPVRHRALPSKPSPPPRRQSAYGSYLC